MTGNISSLARIGENVKIGHYTIIGDDVEIEDGVVIEEFCIIQGKVKIGKGTLIKNYVEIRNDTIIGENCYIDSRVSTSGNCVIGNNVNLRYDTIIACGVEIGDNTYVCPKVMTNNLDAGKKQIGGAKIGKNCFIGTSAVLHHGIIIGNDVVIGSMSFVNKNCDDKSKYVGIPARKIA